MYVNFNKHKREYIVIPIIPIGGILLHSKQKNLTCHSTGKNITGKIFNKKIIQKKEKYKNETKNKINNNNKNKNN